MEEENVVCTGGEGVGHKGAQREKVIPQRHMDSGLQPKRFSQNRSQGLLIPFAGSVLLRLFQCWLLQGQEPSWLAVSLQVPSAGTRVLTPVTSFRMQALFVLRRFCFMAVGFVVSSLCRWHTEAAVLREIPPLGDRQETFHFN